MLIQFSFFSMCILIWFEILWNSVIFLLYYLWNRPSRWTCISMKVTLCAFEENKKQKCGQCASHGCESCEPIRRAMQVNMQDFKILFTSTIWNRCIDLNERLTWLAGTQFVKTWTKQKCKQLQIKIILNIFRIAVEYISCRMYLKY